jgi:hypothetical protein
MNTDKPMKDADERRAFADEQGETAELCVLVADMLEQGAAADKVDVTIGRYSPAGWPLIEFEDGTSYEVILKKVEK